MGNRQGKTSYEDVLNNINQLQRKLPRPWTSINPWNMEELNEIPIKFREPSTDTIDKRRNPEDIMNRYPFNYLKDSLAKYRADPTNKKHFEDHYVIDRKGMQPEEREMLFDELIEAECNSYTINEHRTSAKIFVKALVYLAKECENIIKNANDDTMAVSRSRFFLLGSPGVGKTSFLNYILSCFGEDYIAKNDTIFIRVDLNDVLTKKIRKAKKDESLFEILISKQFVRVYKKYFWDNNRFLFDEMDLLEYICEWRKIGKNQKARRANILRQIRSFADDYASLSGRFIKNLHNYLRVKKSISYIYIFDGLDYITLDEMNTSSFEKWIEEVNNYIFSVDSFPGAYVVTMRDISFRVAAQKYINTANTAWSMAKKLRIGQCDLREMLDKRMRWARDKIHKEALADAEKHKMISGKYSWVNKETVRNFTDDFLAYCSFPVLMTRYDPPYQDQIKNYYDLNKLVITPGITKLQEISASNYRVLLKNMRLGIAHFSRCYKNNLEYWFKVETMKRRVQGLTRIAYRQLRNMIVGRLEKHDYVTTYDYHILDGKTKVIKRGERFVLPTLTNFAYVYPPDAGKVEFRGLVKLRVLQYLISNKGKSFGIEYLVKLINQYFGYDKKYIRMDIEEMIYHEAINASNILDHYQGLNISVEITKLGEFMVRNAVFWHVYWETTIDALPMPSTVRKTFKPWSLYWKKTNGRLNKFIIIKSLSILSYLMFLRDMEKKEMDLLKHNAKKSSGDMADKKCFWKIMDEVIDRVKEEMTYIFLARIRKDERTEYGKPFAKYIDELNSINGFIYLVENTP